MSSDDREFPRFSRRLDEEWLRVRVVATMAPPAVDQTALLRSLSTADPLGEEPDIGWMQALRVVASAWPGRLVLASAAFALLLAGVFIGRVGDLSSRALSRSRIAAVPPLPQYTPESAGGGLGIAASVKPESAQSFRDAMALYGTPDFAARALPLLRQAVAQDATNEDAQFWLGVALLLERRGGDAVPSLEAAVRLAPRSALYQRYLLFAYLQSGAVDKAVRLQTELLGS